MNKTHYLMIFTETETETETENWMQLSNFPNYSISSLGRIRNKKDKILTFRKSKDYFHTNLVGAKLCNITNKNVNCPITIRVHRLVAETFLPNPDNKPVVDHINRDTCDNRASNLRWATLSENGVNSKISDNNTSGVKGVSYVKSRNIFRTTIQFNGKKKNIGDFKTLEEATKKRKEYEEKFFKEFQPI
jgi:hypothetical protein